MEVTFEEAENFAMSELPVSVIVPTRNEGARIAQHLDALQDWVSRVHEVIAVDSESSDGTLEILETRIAGQPNGCVITRPRGLYAAWNFAVREASAEYVYFATVGDVPTDGALDHLVEVARAFEADVVISPPRMREDGSDASESWPIHALIEHLPGDDPVRLDPMLKLMLVFGFEPGQGILGSSASNLYRREFLLQHPFPEDSGHGGDTVWGCRYAQDARMVVTPRVCAEFQFEGRASGYDSPDQQAVYARVGEELERAATRLEAWTDEPTRLAAAAFLAGRRETHAFLVESLRVQSQQFSYIGELKEELEKRSELINRLDAECKRLADALARAQNAPRPSILRQIVDRLAGR